MIEVLVKAGDTVKVEQVTGHRGVGQGVDGNPVQSCGCDQGAQGQAGRHRQHWRPAGNPEGSSAPAASAPAPVPAAAPAASAPATATASAPAAPAPSVPVSAPAAAQAQPAHQPMAATSTSLPHASPSVRLARERCRWLNLMVVARRLIIALMMRRFQQSRHGRRFAYPGVDC